MAGKYSHENKGESKAVKNRFLPMQQNVAWIAYYFCTGNIKDHQLDSKLSQNSLQKPRQEQGIRIH